MKNILLIAGTRPNFIKLAPLYKRLQNETENIKSYICHTGQHFDFNMSDIFWENLQLPKPDYQLNIKGNGVVDTIGKTILGLNDIVQNNKFDLVIVFGDVNATLAGAIVGAQTRIPVIHVEAGLRSFDRDMPEEINRVITDHISDYLMVSETSGIKNLHREGFADDKINFVGNIMIECLLQTKNQWQTIGLSKDVETFCKQQPIVATFHRPENVDDKRNLQCIVDIILTFSAKHPVIFPVHPRTYAKLEEYSLLEQLNNPEILLTNPLSYFEFLKLVSHSKFVITDSGGIQEETSFLNIACVTFRKNTERPITVELGTNLLMDIWDNNFYSKALAHNHTIITREPVKIPLWDDMVSKRIVEDIIKILK